MTMKVLILSTETKHHIYFINKLSEEFEIIGVVYERRRLVKDYPTGPFFAQEEAEFEKKFFDTSSGVSSELSDELTEKMIEVPSVNQQGLAEYIQALKPDIGIAYGVGLVRPGIFSAPREGTINIHHGTIQEYRGLDSHLWTIYDKRFKQLGVTIHYMDENLDTGDILKQEYVNIEPHDEIYHLRYKATLVATRLVKSILAEFAQAGNRLRGEPQQLKGPYYSAMPLDKKYQALESFRQYKEDLLNAGS